MTNVSVIMINQGKSVLTNFSNDKCIGGVKEFHLSHICKAFIRTIVILEIKSMTKVCWSVLTIYLALG